MYDHEKSTDRHVIMTAVDNLNREIISSLDELALICECQLSNIDLAKLKASLIPRLKVVLNGLQNRSDSLR